jgi:hypothetical protein
MTGLHSANSALDDVAVAAGNRVESRRARCGIETDRDRGLAAIERAVSVSCTLTPAARKWSTTGARTPGRSCCDTDVGSIAMKPTNVSPFAGMRGHDVESVRAAARISGNKRAPACGGGHGVALAIIAVADAKR